MILKDDSVEDSKTPIINNKSLETKESKNDPKPQPQRQEQTKNKTVKKTNFQSSPSKNRVTSNNYGSSDATKKKKTRLRPIVIQMLVVPIIIIKV